MIVKVFSFLFILYEKIIMERTIGILSGSSAGNLILWNKTKEIIKYNISQKVYAVDSAFDFFLTATQDRKIKYWNLFSQQKIAESNILSDQPKSLLIINKKFCLVGFTETLVFVYLPEMKEIRKINSSSLGEIISLKLIENKAVLIGSLNKGISYLSLTTEKIRKLNGQTISKTSAFDILDRNIAVAGLILRFNTFSFNVICSYYLNKYYKLEKNKCAQVSNEVNVIKIINSKFLVFGLNENKIGRWDLKYDYVKTISSNSRVHSIEFFDMNTFLTGDDNGKIKIWDMENFNVKNMISSSGTILVLKNIDLNFEKRDFYFDEFDPYSFNETETFQEYEEFVESSSGNYSDLIYDDLNEQYEEIFTSIEHDLTTEQLLLENRSTYTEINNNLSLTREIDQNEYYINLSNDIKMIIILMKSKYDLNDCLSNCSGNGKCKKVNNLKFKCECFENFAGSNCAINTLPCWSNPCLNNGTCINDILNSSFTCNCQNDLYFGLNCELKKDICFNETCSKNGYCYEEKNKATCKCFGKYTGEKCQYESSEMLIIKNTIRISSICLSTVSRMLPKNQKY
ncbi:unnamed protein product [Brachionus calyciflorus]|uniref:EGF-like domain-containing protein n=1 Tax=Brachionus calyciflorus TaxID=104777 RepID=A0A814H4X5_9BILA|nr:unnamed protein product [Brachionus calyciflorus]